MRKVKIRNLEIGNGKPAIMGIINASPESFYKESITIGRKIISEMAIKMEQDGADLIDIGGMSTAPYGNTLVSTSKELERVRNSIMAIKDVSNIPLSVDTARAEVAKASIDMGVDVINDVTGLKYDKMMRSVISTSGLPVIIGAYGDRSITYQTGDIAETIDILKVSLDMANQSGIKEDKVIVDPLIGFFRASGNNPFFTKVSNQNWYDRDIRIISNLERLSTLSKPICISVSRKSFIGHLFNLAESDRLVPSIIAQVVCAINGTDIIRTHDVKETRIALELLKRMSK
ncbi:MAG: dihydropteroate synthase [Nitrososphaeraceae archaeon]|nr:dihydropteroate synthase [Nitrososphaeraceae archaeon]MDW0134122.1 dihydropteroate synthase [Nitrososphaeraceae archaeon]MDW0155944.1 dihydropteroate synthase [Nitrososphaeraceae archaeon]